MTASEQKYRPEPAVHPRRFENAKFYDLPKDVRDRIERIRETRRGMYLWGSVGSGKTHAAYAIRRRIEEMSIGVRLYSAPEMLDMIRDDFEHKDSYNLDRILASRGVLIVDDLGVEKPSEWVSETLFRIVNKRYEEVLPTIVTSNLDLGELSERLGDRIPSRLAEMCDVVKLEGKDRRLP